MLPIMTCEQMTRERRLSKLVKHFRSIQLSASQYILCTHGLSLLYTLLACACNVRGSLVTSMHVANLERDMWPWELGNLNFPHHAGTHSEGMETGLWTYGG